MKARVLVGPRVEAFVKALAPEPRQAVRRAIKALAEDRGDIKLLEGKLAPFWRLRVGKVRVVYQIKTVKGKRQVFCFFADYRATVYEVLEQLLAAGIIEEMNE